MDEQNKERDLKKIALYANSIMLFVHTLFLSVFFLFHYSIPVYMNAVSVLIYILCYFAINKNKIMAFIWILMDEIWVHLIIVTIYCGWECGFGLYSFALISFSFYARYLFSENKQTFFMPNIACSVSIILFIALRLHTFMRPPIYAVPKQLALCFYCFNTLVVFSFMAAFLYLYTKRVIKSEHTLHEIADYDELTELYNRHRMRDILSKVYSNAQSGTQKNFCTSIIDIDDFKIVNDTYGHEAGDYILKTVSSLMHEICKTQKDTYVGRWGGEEFLIVQEYEREKEQGVIPCINTVKKIHDTIRDYDFIYDKHHILITVTAGIAVHQENQAIATTIRFADERLYKGKLNGKNCIAFG